MLTTELTMEELAELRAHGMAIEMAKDIANDMAKDMANDMADKLKKGNMTDEKIAEITGLSTEEIAHL